MNKPYHTLIFLVLVAMLYVLLSIIVPDGAFRVGDILFRIPRPSELLAKSETRQVFNSADSIQSSTCKQTETFSTASPVNADSISTAVEPIKNERIELPKATPKSAVGINTLPIEMPTGRNPLGSFVNALSNLDDQNAIVRVLHYGDSQIEGDRITKQVRIAFQDKFGGQGLGLIPLWNTEYLPSSFRVTLSEHIKVSSIVNAKPAQKADCVLGSIAEIAPSKLHREVISIRVAPNETFKVLSIILGGADSSYSVKILFDGIEGFHKPVEAGSNIRLISVNLPDRFEKMSILVQNPSPLKLYGLLAESDSGISVSNIALRGTSGNFFTRFDSQVASEIFRMLNVRLVILQYGINVVPSNLSSYAYYEKLMEQQISAIRRFSPFTDILIVGVTDMATRTDGELKSNPSVEKVLEAQKQAAMNNGVAFWDGYTVMGGKGSIINWVNSTPPLATKDYTHFTNYGAKRFGQKLANALLMAVDNLGMANIDQQTTPKDSVINE
ncbi:MAG: hypothetical protein AB1777_09495 [Bacteroidota bacterium]